MTPLQEFLSFLPSSIYHAFDNKVDAFDEKQVEFTCGCGGKYKTTDTIALCDSGLSNIAVYICGSETPCLNIVKATGILSIKGLKTLASFASLDEGEISHVMGEIERRKKTS